MNTITIKRIKLSMSESALQELQLRAKRQRECAYDEPCEVCIHQVCGSHSDNAAWAQNRAKELGFVPVSEVTR